jgi:hypothetical protein
MLLLVVDLDKVYAHEKYSSSIQKTNAPNEQATKAENNMIIMPAAMSLLYPHTYYNRVLNFHVRPS